jgi:peroxiredoxin
MRDDDVYTLPAGLPVPQDDGAARHLPGMRVPALALPTTRGRRLDVAALGGEGRAVLYVYPRTGRPDEPPLPGWDQIPGARGCTPQSCAFRDHHQELRELGAEVFGLSAQTPADQREFAERVHLPYELLSDADLELARALRLPGFEVAGLRLLKRLTLILRRGAIERVFYPVFPPDRNAAEVARWLRGNPPSAARVR